MKHISRLIKFIKDDIWRIKLRSLPRSQFFLVKLLRIVVLTARGFSEDKCQLRASALTFYTLISIVPILALAFGIAKGFGYEQTLQDQLMNRFPNSTEVLTQAIKFAHTLLEQTKGEVVAGVGVLVLFWAVIRVCKSIESSLNGIWGIQTGRSFTRQCIDYMFFVAVCLFMLVVSSGITIYASTMLTNIMNEYGLIGATTFQRFSLKFVPYFASWLLFCFVYIFMPNAKVNWHSGLLAGIVAGTCYQLAQWFYINFQIGVAKYNAIYGSFSALPLFMMWLQLSWMIVFFGAEVAFALQNAETLEFENESNTISPSFKRLLILTIMHKMVHQFCDGFPPLTAAALSHEFDIPIRLTRQLLFDLKTTGLISEIMIGDKEKAYQPALTPEKLSIHYVLSQIDHTGSKSIPIKKSDAFEKISDKLTVIENSQKQLSANTLLKDF